MPTDEPDRLGHLATRLLAHGEVELPEPARARLVTWLAAVEGWRHRVDLTAARNSEELVDLMLADAAMLARQLGHGAAVVDVGSGAGAPGLPLALLRPDLTVVLVEKKRKRAALLRSVLGQLAAGPGGGLAAEVVEGRAEALVGRSFDVAISRATLSPPEWLRLGARLAPLGQVWVLLARQPPPELDGWVPAADLRYRWPLTGAERRAVGYRPGADRP